MVFTMFGNYNFFAQNALLEVLGFKLNHGGGGIHSLELASLLSWRGVLNRNIEYWFNPNRAHCWP